MKAKSESPINAGNAKNDKFAANITHELKTPLTSIIGFIELLKKGGGKNKETREYFYDVIDSEAQRLLHLIDDMLLLSQVENGKNTPGLTQKCDVKKEINTVLKSLTPIAQNKNIKLSVNIEEGLAVVACDSRLQQLFSNLVSNAIKYNKPNGSIYINAYSKNGKTTISVKDTGIGIKPDYINKIFDRFYRINSADNDNIPGNGLGLSIVKDIVTLYGGNISVNSQIDKGSEFIVSFPDNNNF